MQFIKIYETEPSSTNQNSCFSKLPLITAIDRYFLWLLIRREGGGKRDPGLGLRVWRSLRLWQRNLATASQVVHK